MRPYLEAVAGPIPDESWEAISGIIQHESAPAGRLLLETGQVCECIWCLESGAGRYFEWQDGEECTTHFFIGPIFFTNYHSLLSGQPSEFNILLEEDSHLQILPYPQLKALYDQYHPLERVGRLYAEHMFMGELDRRRQLLHWDATRHYEHLEEAYPEVLQRFAQKDIASYLGITPVSLSRLRKLRQKKSQ
ncbi:MAG: Crp/Fnr family transcriptional regulator [Bacteroidota bacterium]